MRLNSIFSRVSGCIVSGKLVWIRGNPGYSVPNGTKAAINNNHLILPILYSSGKQGKRKSRDHPGLLLFEKFTAF